MLHIMPCIYACIQWIHFSYFDTSECRSFGLMQLHLQLPAKKTIEGQVHQSHYLRLRQKTAKTAKRGSFGKWLQHGWGKQKRKQKQLSSTRQKSKTMPPSTEFSLPMYFSTNSAISAFASYIFFLRGSLVEFSYPQSLARWKKWETIAHLLEVTLWRCDALGEVWKKFGLEIWKSPSLENAEPCYACCADIELKTSGISSYGFSLCSWWDGHYRAKGVPPKVWPTCTMNRNEQNFHSLIS